MTIRELSKITGFSPSAISIVLNGKKGVSDETREKIRKALEKYDYHPSPKRAAAERNVLVMKYYKNGFFVEENQGFISMIIDAIEGQLRKENIGMTLTVMKSDLEQGLKNLDYEKYAGMIMIGTELRREEYQLMGDIRIPFVVVDNNIPSHSYSSVCMNNYENVRLALLYLKKCGHRQIGFLGSSMDTENFREREEAFRKLVHELELSFDEQHDYKLNPTMIGTHDDFLAHLEGDVTLPSAFFAENDTIALGAMKALKEKDYKIPRDVSIIGFDDIPYASISSPALTTVHVQRKLIGRQAVLQLLQLISDPGFSTMKTELTGRLVVRDSVRVLPQP